MATNRRELVTMLRLGPRGSEHSKGKHDTEIEIRGPRMGDWILHRWIWVWGASDLPQIAQNTLWIWVWAPLHWKSGRLKRTNASCQRRQIQSPVLAPLMRYRKSGYWDHVLQLSMFLQTFQIWAHFPFYTIGRLACLLLGERSRGNRTRGNRSERLWEVWGLWGGLGEGLWEDPREPLRRPLVLEN